MNASPVGALFGTPQPQPDAGVWLTAPVGALTAQVISHFGGRLEGRLLALWGLALTPACRRGIGLLASRGAYCVAYDPLLVREHERRVLAGPRLAFASSRMSALNGADALLIVTGWREFRQVDAIELKERMRKPLVFDSCGLYERGAMAALGVDYRDISAG